MLSTPSNRRAFLKRTALLPWGVAGLGLAGASSASAAPAGETAGSRLKLSLNAYSFNDLLLNAVHGRTPAMSLFELLEFCAQHGFAALTRPATTSPAIRIRRTTSSFIASSVPIETLPVDGVSYEPLKVVPKFANAVRAAIAAA